MLWWRPGRRTNEVVEKAADVRQEVAVTSQLLANALVRLHHATMHVEEAIKEIVSDEHPAAE